MRWTLLLAVPFVILMVAALQLTQQRVLWKETEPGMTVEQVRAVLPQALPAGADAPPAGGLELKLAARGVEHLERGFDAELFFRDGGLQAVRLRPINTQTLAGASATYEHLLNAAALRYGKPQTLPLPAGAQAAARWTAGPTTITLLLRADGPMGAVTMTYSTDAAASLPAAL